MEGGLSERMSNTTCCNMHSNNLRSNCRDYLRGLENEEWL